MIVDVKPIVIVFIVLGVILGIIILLRIKFMMWKKTASKVMNDGEVMETLKGKIHYKLTGKGPVLFFMHGGPGGIDQDIFLDGMIEEGYSILSVSRPGYLRTPFFPLTYEEQVDQYVELLDKLKIEKVVPMGYSAGGPLALYFSNKFPERIYALIMEAGVSTEYNVTSEQLDSFWMKVLQSKGIGDFLSWISVIMVNIAFKVTFKSIISLETSLDKEGIKKFADLVSNDKERREWLKNLMDTTGPMSLRKLGLNHDIELLVSLEKIPVDKINAKSLLVYSRDDNDVKWLNAEYLVNNLKNFELLETHGGHFMWVGEDMEKIKNKRIEFLKSINFELKA